MRKKKRVESALEKSYREYYSDPKNVQADKELTDELLRIACLGDCDEKRKKKHHKRS